MYNQHRESDLELGRFGEYLLKSRIVAEKHAPYYVAWVRRFLHQVPPKDGVTWEDRIAIFIQNLNVEDWQLNQAERAVRLYFTNYLTDSGAMQAFTPLAPDPSGCFRKADLLDATRKLIRLRHYSYRTEQTYLDWLNRFFQYLAGYSTALVTSQEKPAQVDRCNVTPQSVKDYLAYLAIKARVSASTQNQAFSALLFMCREVLRMELGDLSHNVRAKQRHHLPVVLSADEVSSMFSHMKDTPKLMAQLIYGGGLRVTECCRLRVKDLDFNSNLIFVRAGKGGKDRSTLLPQTVKPALVAHLERVKALHDKNLADGHGDVELPDALDRKYPKAAWEWCWQYVFPSRTLSVDPRSGKVRRHHVSDTAIQNAVRDSVRSAGIAKPASVHTLRHSFATSMLLHNVDIRQIQDYLGHANVETTMIYTHVVKDMRNPATSPLDMLAKAG